MARPGPRCVPPSSGSRLRSEAAKLRQAFAVTARDRLKCSIDSSPRQGEFAIVCAAARIDFQRPPQAWRRRRQACRQSARMQPPDTTLSHERRRDLLSRRPSTVWHVDAQSDSANSRLSTAGEKESQAILAANSVSPKMRWRSSVIRARSRDRSPCRQFERIALGQPALERAFRGSRGRSAFPTGCARRDQIPCRRAVPRHSAHDVFAWTERVGHASAKPRLRQDCSLPGSAWHDGLTCSARCTANAATSPANAEAPQTALRHLAQPELLDLAGAGLRHLGEHDVARHLVAGEIVRGTAR